MILPTWGPSRPPRAQTSWPASASAHARQCNNMILLSDHRSVKVALTIPRAEVVAHAAHRNTRKHGARRSDAACAVRRVCKRLLHRHSCGLCRPEGAASCKTDSQPQARLKAHARPRRPQPQAQRTCKVRLKLVQVDAVADDGNQRRGPVCAQECDEEAQPVLSNACVSA